MNDFVLPSTSLSLILWDELKQFCQKNKTKKQQAKIDPIEIRDSLRQLFGFQFSILIFFFFFLSNVKVLYKTLHPVCRCSVTTISV